MKVPTELTLTRRWVTYHTKKTTFKLEEGLEVEYYGENRRWLKFPEYGTIKKDKEGYFIEWKDGTTPTRIDGSPRAKSVLEDTGLSLQTRIKDQNK